MSVLPLAVVLALASDPACGARPGIEPARIVAVAQQESGLDPLIIGANADPARGLPHQAIRSATPIEAVAKATALLAAGRSLDLGISGINATNLQRDGLTLTTAFDACASIRAAYHHLAGDFEAAAWAMAHSRYNSGSFERGAAYAASVEAVLARVRTADATPVAPAAPVTPIQPAPPPCAPAWDGWALAKCSARQRAPTPAVEPSSAAMLTATIGPNPNANSQH